MSVLLQLTLLFSCFCLFPSTALAGLSECRESRCGDGPAIRFPFRRKHRLQPENCSYPGFDLSCTSDNQTVLHLPNIPTLTLFVRKIDYKSQLIQVYLPNNYCPPIELLKSLDLSRNISPFQTTPRYSFEIYTLFNCSLTDLDEFEKRIPCFSGPGYEIYVSMGQTSLFYMPLVSCTKLFDTSPFIFAMFFPGTDFELNWSEPNCGHCEAKHKRCRFANHGEAQGTECFGPKQDASRKPIIAGATVGSFVAALLVITLFHIYNVDKVERENQLRVKKFLEDYKAFKPSRYSYADIKRITNQFKENLGQGAYGTVYKGKLSNEIFVAVKILNNSKGNGEEFVNEVATIGRIHHINVVRLVGYCADGFRRALVYEFLPNDSLEKFMPSSAGISCSLSWETMQDIVLGIARGIEYLHQGCDQRIVHFDIKPRNILLDHNFTPKISDFGLSKLYAKDQSIVSMSTARGTIGYIAPEVFSRNFGNVSYKSDVYSFGMLLLEMVGGRRTIDENPENVGQIYYPEWIYNLLEGGEDLRIHISWEEEDARIAKKLAIVGLSCIQWHPGDRPSMKIVVQMLEGGDNLALPSNPFAPTSSTRTNANVTSRHVKQELQVIPETE